MKAEKLVGITVGVLLVALAGAMIWKNGSQPEQPEETTVVEPEVFPPLPSPNGYGALLQAAENTRSPDGDVRSMGRGSLEVYLSGHEDAFKIARTALEHESSAILDGNSEFSSRQEDELEAMKRLGNLFLAQGLFAESRIKMKEALEAYLEILQVGVMVGRGGWAPHWQAAVSVVGVGRVGIDGLIRRLPRADVEATQLSVERICGTWNTADELREWGRLIDRTIHANRIKELDPTQLAQRNQNREAAIQASSLELDRLRGLWIRLALRSYEFQNGQLPKTLSSLVPDHLKEIPRHSTTGEPFVMGDF